MINKYFQSEKNSGLFFSPCFSLYTYVRILFYVIYVYIYIYTSSIKRKTIYRGTNFEVTHAHLP